MLLGTRMGRRILATLAVAVLVPLLAAGTTLLRQSARDLEAASERELSSEALAFANEFGARLAKRSAGSGDTSVLPTRPGWHGRGDSDRVALLDGEGRLVFSAAPLPDEVVDMLGRYSRSVVQEATLTVPLAWQAAGVEWHGALARIEARDSTEAPWSVAVFEPFPTWADAMRPAAGSLLALLALAVAALAAGSLLLARRYVPPVLALVDALGTQGDARSGRLVEVSADEVGDAISAYNTSAAVRAERLNALETLAEIDRLLLGSAELEQVLDTILSRVQAITRCDAVAITLVDADSAAHGRVYLSSTQTADLPVVRVELDSDMVATLATAQDGLTVTRCEPVRHSLLMPLAELGAQFFWVWPVVAGERVLAALALGYRDAPAADPVLARYGSDFAARLAVALSRSARDEHLYRQAHYDALTSLPNRLLFRDRLAQELVSASAAATRGALLYIDLDHFKRVNDTVGHAAGDQLLTIVAQRLRACVKEGDTVARLGGDEFTIVLRQVPDPDAVRSVADRIIAALETPVNVAGRDNYVRASIGITLFPDDASSLDDLMRHADAAMYRAKDMGRGRAVFFDRSVASRQVSATGSGLYRALRHREFSLFYQPQFSLRDGRLVGLEALLRWQTPRNGLKYPAEFVPAAEECGLIVDIGGWVLESACAQYALWREQGLAPPRLAVNLSVQQLRAPNFVGDLRRLLTRHALPPGQLELEVTESMLADVDVAQVLEQLAAEGVRLALDDFGVGETALSTLRQHPITVVKIDRSLIDDIHADMQGVTLAGTVIAMARSLGKTVVAEGVESIEQLEYLREQACDVAQGFFLARPLSVAAAGELLAGRMAIEPLASSRLAG
jgi:diguanylate cyclase (GGDEF)-like protein